MIALIKVIGAYATMIGINHYLNPYPTAGIAVYVLWVLWTSFYNYPYLHRQVTRVEQTRRRGYIYAFWDVGNIVPALKIGRAVNHDTRLNAHRTAAPLGILTICKCYVPDAVAAESYLHRRYAGQRLSRRNEWFVITPLLLLDLLLLCLFTRKQSPRKLIRKPHEPKSRAAGYKPVQKSN